MMRIKELLDLIDKETIIGIMQDLGVECTGMGVTSDGVNYLKFPTICHGGNSRDKLWWYENTKMFYCYTNCGSMSIFDLVMKVKHYSDKEFYLAMAYVAKKAGVNLQDDRNKIGETFSKNISADLNEMDRLLELSQRSDTISEIQKFYDPQILNYFDNNTFYTGWIKEGIEVETMRKYNIRFYYLESHIIIPHYNIDGKLVGIRRRSLNPEDSKNKYMPEYIQGQDYGHPLGLNFYGIDKNQNAIRKQRKAIIMEGEKSVLLSDSYYGDKSIALATCGFNISDWQIRMLKKLGVNTVYLGFDKDFDRKLEYQYKEDPAQWGLYQHYKKRLEVLANRLAPDFITYLITDKDGLLQLKDAPVDRGKENFETLISHAKLITGTK